jgi:uncharacterized protein YraI
MNKHARRWVAIGALALVLPVAASAQQAFARGPLNLRAGPAGDYPLVAQLAPGQSLQVLGCTSGYGWCDVVLPDGLRGWVYSAGLDYAYQEQRVPLATYGAVIGVPIVTFSIGNYWSNYYRDRPWYGQPRWWGGRPPPPPVPGWRPPPPPVPGWHPNPWPGPGAGPRPGYRPPPPGFVPPHPPGIRPPSQSGFRPPHDSGVRPPPPAGIRPPSGGGGDGHGGHDGGHGGGRGGGQGGGHGGGQGGGHGGGHGGDRGGDRGGGHGGAHGGDRGGDRGGGHSRGGPDRP